MALGTLQKAYQVFAAHDFSRSFQIRLLNFNNVPSYVSKEILEPPTNEGGYMYAKTYTIPGRSIKDIAVPYQGFDFHIPGQVAYDQPNPWVITFNTPGDYLVRNALERWSFETMNDDTSCGNYNIPCPDTSIDLAVLAPNCSILRIYRLLGVYPQNISEISYNIEGNDRTEFSAAFHYQYWRLVQPYETGDTSEAGSNIDSVYAGYESNILAAQAAACSTPFANTI